MLPADGSIYNTDLVDKGGSMMRALRAWEKKRGLNFSLRGKLMCKKAQVSTEPQEPAQRLKPGPKPTVTKEEKRKRKNEYNKRVRSANREQYAAMHREWRAKLSPERKQEIKERHRDNKRARKAKQLEAAKLASSSGTTGVPLADASVSRKEG